MDNFQIIHEERIRVLDSCSVYLFIREMKLEREFNAKWKFQIEIDPTFKIITNERKLFVKSCP